MNHRFYSLLATMAAVLATGAGSAGAAPDAAALQEQAQAQARADAALEDLSRRYAQLWATLPAPARVKFSAAERHWLGTVRWQEQQLCIAQTAAASSAAAADCLAQVTQRRADGLAPVGAAALQ